MDETARQRGLIATVIVHGLVITLLVLLRLYGTVKTPDAEGITINFGTDQTGMGALEPVQQEVANTQPQATAIPPAAKAPSKRKVSESAPDLMTQEHEKAPTVKKQDNPNDLAEKKKLEEKKKKDREERELKRQEEVERQRVEAERKRQAELEQARIDAERKKQEQQQSQLNAIKNRMGKSFGGNAATGGTEGEGQGQKAGNQGDPTGSVDSKNQGPGGGKGAGISFSLEGRGLIGSLAKPEYNVNDYGDVVVTITVNKDGQVISAVPGAKGTTTSNSVLWEAARKAAMTARFSKVTADDAPVYQKGTITYKFRLL